MLWYNTALKVTQKLLVSFNDISRFQRNPFFYCSGTFLRPLAMRYALKNTSMNYRDSLGKIDTPKKILKVNHAGEFGAESIYTAQIMVSKLLHKDYVSLLSGFLEDEKRHSEVFWTEIQRRDGIRCKSYWMCGLGGWLMGLISAIIGKKGIMACTWAVESVVTEHLKKQLVYLSEKGDSEAYNVVNSILQDEEHHRDTGLNEGGKNIFYSPFRSLPAMESEREGW